MPRLSELYPSKYLKAEEIKGRRVVVEVANISVEDVGDGNKPVLYFRGKEKGLVLNRTNADMLAHLTGSDDTDRWPGFRVELYVEPTRYQGRIVDGLRVGPVRGGGGGFDAPRSAPVAPPPPPPPDDPRSTAWPEDSGGDDIPF